MRLVSLKLHNIRSHQDTRLDFQDGITLYRGDMGSGKTTILMGIEFALFGFGHISSDGFVSKGKSSAEVSLIFEVGKDRYEVQRVIRIKGGSASQTDTCIMCNGITELLSASDLNTRILQILGFGETGRSKVYRYAIYTPQEEIKSILNGTGREEVIRRAFGIQDYSTAVQNAKEMAKHLKGECVGLAPRFESMDANKRTIRTIRRDILNVGEICSATRTDIIQYENNDYDARLSQIQDIIRESEMEIRQIESLDVSKLESESPLDEIRKHSEELKQAEGCKKPADIDVDDAETLQQRLYDAQNIQSRRTTLQDAIRRYTDEMPALRKPESNTIQEDMEALDIAAHTEEVGRLRADLKRAEELYESIKNMGAKCEYCDGTIHDVEGLKCKRQSNIQVISDRLQSAEDELHARQAKHEEYKVLFDRHKAELNTYNTNKELYDTLNAKRQKCTEELESLPPTNIEGVRADIDRRAKYDRDYTAYRDAQKTISIVSARISELYKRKQEIDAQMAEYDEQRQKLPGLRRELDEARDVEAQIRVKRDESNKLLQVARDSLARHEERLESLNKEKERLGGEIAQQTKHKATHSKHKDSISWLVDKFIPACETIEQYILNERRERFATQYKHWYNRLVDDATKTSHISEKFEPLITQTGIQQSVRNLSGGERTSVSLAYRLALNQQVEGVDILILDEPTEGFSRQQMHAFRDVLQELRVGQCIIVSHENEMEGMVHNIHQVTKQNGLTMIG